MRVYMFKPRFAPLVEAGTKRQTIRPKRKHPTKVGDVLSLRCWEGKPYRSKQIVLRQGDVCKEVHSVWIGLVENADHLPMVQFRLDGTVLSVATGESNELAKLDGFSSDVDMFVWFEIEHGLPFEGELIRW